MRFRKPFLLLAAFVSTAGMVRAVRASDLIGAVGAGDLARVRQLATDKTTLDASDAQGRTALLIAVDLGHTVIAEALIAAGANINAQARNQDTPWLLAGARGHTGLIRTMIPRGPDLSIRNRFGGNALIPACERAHVETIRLLLTTRIPVDHVNNLGWTCLLEIVILGSGGAGHIEATKLVLAAGANPNLADKDGVTPLAHARRRNQTEVARLIETAGGRMQK